MSCRLTTRFVVRILITLAGVSLLACSSRTAEQQATGTPLPAQAKTTASPTTSPSVPPAIQPAAPTASKVAAKPAPPTSAEIKDAVVRVFEKVADSGSSADPIFLVGDFNGDGSEDLAVV